MNIKNINIFIFVLICIIGCKQNSNVKTLTNDYALLNQSEVKPDEVAKMRKGAESVLEFRKKEEGTKPATILEKDMWLYEATVTDSKFTTTDSLDGRWIDYKDDLTYDYGNYDGKKGSGRYHYNFDKGILLMLDDHRLIKPQEFEVKALNDMIVVVGAYVYKDNNIQSKLVRISSMPKRK